MPEQLKDSQGTESFFATSWVGTMFTVLSGLSFMLVCMILPLAGKAGVATTYAEKNKTAFLVVVLAATALAALATVSKMARRRIDQSPLPFFSLILLGLCLMLITGFFAGLLEI